MIGLGEMTTTCCTIDGRTVPFEPGMSVLDAALAAGIDVPRLCAYPGLKPLGGCRLCVVEVDGVRGYPAACTLPATEGQVITTDSDALDALRRTSLALLLTKHPTGCLMCLHAIDCEEHHGCHARRSGAVTGCRFCPNDRQCELQDLVERLELHAMPFPVAYRGLPVDKRNPFFDFDPNLCVLCGRCTRVCDEVRGAGVIALVNRGEDTVVETLGNLPRLDTDCQLCGSCVDVCPTGSLAERVNKWVGVPEAATRSTCALCPLGCQVDLRTLDGQLIGVRPCAETNDDLCAKGRFAPVELTLPSERLLRPLVRQGERQVPVGWDAALNTARAALAGAERVRLFAAADLPTEALTAIAALAEALPNALPPVSELPPVKLPSVDRMADLEALTDAEVIVTIGLGGGLGGGLRYSHTPIRLAVQRAVEHGARLITLDSAGSGLTLLADAAVGMTLGEEAATVAGLRRAMTDPASDAAPDVTHAADLLRNATAPVIVWHGELLHRPDGAAIAEALAALAAQAAARVLPVIAGANVRAAEALGYQPAPDDPEPVDVLVSFGRPPDALMAAAGFHIAHVHRLDEALTGADVVLPSTVFAEQQGTLTDLFGRERALVAAVPPPGEVRNAAEVARLLAEPADEGATPPAPRATTAAASPVLGESLGEVTLVATPSLFGYLGQPLAAQVPGLIPLAAEGDLQLHSADLARLGVSRGERVTVAINGDRLPVTVRVTDAALPGVGRVNLPAGRRAVGAGPATVHRHHGGSA